MEYLATELRPLSESGLFTPSEVEGLLLGQYREGICRFGSGPAHPVREVLDCVVDAGRLLSALRQQAEAAGATLLPHHALVGYRVDGDGVRVVLSPAFGGAPRQLQARLFIDALGAPKARTPPSIFCAQPSVGTG